MNVSIQAELKVVEVTLSEKKQMFSWSLTSMILWEKDLQVMDR